ncbi:amino acid deaminase [Nocardia asiatica]|uniref:amino acid deaminase n=1 Tax=Nocardia asiatica TaxID=209252 RepID=UPI0024555BF2|nr:amino acid deaminase [Nocardia asiatica]
MSIDEAAVAALGDRRIGPEHKGMPPSSWGRTVREFLRTAPALDQLQTPVLTVDRAAVTANIAIMAEWVRAAGVRLAPHGKTTMAPRLWADQLAAGAWGITLATVWQTQVARSFGVARVLLANALVDPVGLRWVAAELERDPSFEFVCWADSAETVTLMDAHLREIPGRARIRVLVELGGPHGRTGARTVEQAHAVARAIDAASRLTLAGVGGYEGALAHDRSPSGVGAVREYLGELARLHRELSASGRYRCPAIVTAGGSAYPELAVEYLAALSDESGSNGVATTVVLRSGAYVIHDDGFYASMSPLAAPGCARPLRSAMHGWARTVSRPEPGLALLDAGKRDLPFDEGMPIPQRVAGSRGGALDAAATVSALNDQHAFLRLPRGAATELPIGAVVRLGLSHPCTAFDKWRLVPVIDDADATVPRVVDFLHTFF